MTWKKTGVAAITAVCYNFPEVKSTTMYNRSYKFQSVVNIHTLKIAILLISKTPAFS